MSSNATTIDEVARVYALSIFQLAEEAGGEDKIHQIGDELEAIASIVREDARIAEFFRSPIVDIKKRSEALRRILDGQVSDVVLRFLLVLNHKSRLGRIADIADAFVEIANDRFGRVEVDVFTVDGAMEDSQLESLRARIVARMGRDPVFHQHADASMIGGLVLRIGDQLIDGSVRGRLRRIREDLKSRGSSDVRHTAERFMGDAD